MPATKPLKNQQVDRTAQRRLRIDIALWTIATLVMLAAFVYQKATGPTEPLHGKVQVQGRELSYKLIRSHGGPGDATVVIPDPGETVMGRLMYRRYKLPEDFTAVPLQRQGGKLFASLPYQPPAGKLEYFITLDTQAGPVNVPPQTSVVIRFRGDVPALVLIVHILLMFFGMLFGARTGLEVFQPGPRLRRLAWYTLGLLGLGGMVFGPLVQKYAFGAYWTGVPFGWDLTDNKLLIIVLLWLIAVIALGWPRQPVKPLARWLCLLATVLTLVVYIIPHSMYGSTLDYAKVQQGVDPAKAVGQG
jgi:hypothetical protein